MIKAKRILGISMRLNLIVVTLLMVIILLGGCLSDQQEETENGKTIPPDIDQEEELNDSDSSISDDFDKENPKIALSSFYAAKNVNVELKSPSYNLPLDLDDTVNIEEINGNFILNKGQLSVLEKNGFVIIPYGQEDDIIDPYKDIKAKGIPIFVTSDTLLHLYHIQFNEILKGVEEREFYPDIINFSIAMMEQSLELHGQDQHGQLDISEMHSTSME